MEYQEILHDSAVFMGTFYSILFTILWVFVVLGVCATGYLQDWTQIYKGDEMYVGCPIIKSAYKCFILRKNKIETENIQTEKELDKLYEECITKKKDLKMSH